MFRIFIGLLGLCLLAGAPARAQDAAVLTAGAGMYDLVSHRPHAFEGRLIYRHGAGLFDGDGVFRGLKPTVGVMVASNDAMFGYAGLAAPFQWGRFEVEASAAMGAYHRGRGLELGGTFEFHLGLAASYAVSERVRLGVAIAHISNAGTHRVNPGLNSALATVSLAFP